MRRILILAVMMMALVLGFSMQAQAALQNLGTDSLGNRLIYDTDFNITWYDYTRNGSTWQSQTDWASGLDINFGGTHYTDWRLPTALNQDPSGPCFGYNCTGSEMGHLYYTELGNSAGGPLSNTSYFQNLKSRSYWLNETTSAWNAAYFDTSSGNQSGTSRTASFAGIAVMSGKAIVPEPISSALFIVGGATLGFRRFRKKIRK